MKYVNLCLYICLEVSGDVFYGYVGGIVEQFVLDRCHFPKVIVKRLLIAPNVALALSRCLAWRFPSTAH